MARTPSKGKYAEISNLEISNALANEAVQFNVLATNFGTEDINEIYARIKILDNNKAEIDEMLTQKISLGSQKRMLLNATWDSKNAEVGKYYAVAGLFYDGKSASKEKVFSLGKLSIKVLSVETGEYKLGGIAKFTFWLENEWDERVENVYGELEILNSQGEAIAKIKAQPILLEPQRQTEMVTYWDTEDLKEGKYLMNLKLNYRETGQNVSIISDLSYNKIKSRIIPKKGEATTKPITAKTFMPIAAILLILINVIVFAYYKRKSKLKRMPKG